MFYITAAIYLTGSLLYAWLGSAELLFPETRPRPDLEVPKFVKSINDEKASMMSEKSNK